MMGDQGTSDTTLLHSSFGIQRRDQFQGQALHMRDSDITSAPVFPNYLNRQAGILQPLDHHPAVSSRYTYLCQMNEVVAADKPIHSMPIENFYICSKH